MFFKCKSNDYSSYTKGKIYSKQAIGKWLTENPKDWSAVLDYPTSDELIGCINNGLNKSKIIKALNQWKNQ